MTLPIDDSENRTRLSLIVSEIFDRKHIALSYFFILLPYYYYSTELPFGRIYQFACSNRSTFCFFPPNSLATYLLLDSLWGKQVPHYKHKRRSTTYLLREIPVKNWESLGRGVNTRENCRVNTYLMKFSSYCKWHDPTRYSLSVSLSVTLFDSQPTVAWPPTTVRRPFSDFYQKFPWLLGTSKKRRLTVGRRSHDLRPLTRDRSVTFFKIFPNCLKRPKNVVWQSADGRVTSDHCRVTVQWLFSKIILIAWNVQKTLFDSRLTVAWPPTMVARSFSDF